jgi:hypothetical protein
MSSFSVNDDRGRELARMLRDLDYLPDDLKNLTPFPDDLFRERHFLFFLTAIDHNTHGADRYEEVIDGETVHGSELMYWQAQQAALKDPGLFTPQRLKDVTAEVARAVLTTATGKAPAGVEERALLLRDAAAVLCERYDGDLAKLLAAGEGYLRRGDGSGILELLREIRAYSDPLQKKSFLLIKLLKRRGLLSIRDPENLNVPVDHVLFTIALRSGIVAADRPAREKILAGEPLDEEMVKDLRGAARQAFKKVAGFSSIPADLFDDLLWAYGRECLRLPTPFPEEKIGEISSALDARIGNKPALKAFLGMINGLDAAAPEGTRLYPVPLFTANFYF